METTYTLAEARALLPEARRRIAQLAATVAELQRLAREAAVPEPPAGVVPDAKAAEARADEQLSWFRERSVQVKGVAPALLDFPAVATRDGDRVEVLLCWLEGETDLEHFHPLDVGFIGREHVDALDDV
jgi:hypothetical protein